MKHNLTISVSKNPEDSGIVSCKTLRIRERFLRFLFGKKQQLTILVPGSSVEEVAIKEHLSEGDAIEN